MSRRRGRVIREHLYQRWYYYDADPKGFRQLGDPWHPPSHAECTTSAIVDGRLFLRARDAIYAYDLRAGAVQGRGNGGLAQEERLAD